MTKSDMLERQYAEDVHLSHRKRLGQFFTPQVVSDFMMSWLLQGKPKTMLDPAYGLGAFYDSYITCSADQQEQTDYIAVEFDEKIRSFVQTRRSRNPVLQAGDYLEKEFAGLDAIICNPPYLRFQSFVNRHRVLPRLEAQTGIKLKGYVNVASVFLIKSLHELNRDGRLAYILPFEFFNAGYGEKVKRRLLETGLLKHIVIFENEKTIFPEATTTVCVLLCKNDLRKEPVKITRIKDKNDLSLLADIDNNWQHQLDAGQLNPGKKWSTVIHSLDREYAMPEGMVALKEYGKFVRGIATGANEFFALSASRINDFELEQTNYRKCITRSAQIQGYVFTEADFSELEKKDARVFCLDVREPEETGVKQYVQYGVEQGFHERYLTRNRTPWYRLEERVPAPILAGVFNRGRIKFIRNLTDAINFTCYHALYPNPHGEACLNRLFAYFISDRGQELLLLNKRVYGGNLGKFEPNDLNQALCPSRQQFDAVTEAEALQVIETARTDVKRAIEQADTLIKKIIRV